MKFVESLLQRGLLPDFAVRAGIRRLLRSRLHRQHAADPQRSADDLQDWLAEMDRSPIATNTAEANAQHYEVPAAFYTHVLGAHRKYSCCWFERPDQGLDEAEAAMLGRSCERGRLEDGMSVLDLGCGWGSLSLWIAGRYPRCRVLGVSNSHGQREYILDTAKRRGLHNIEIITANANEFATDRRFDRVFSIEMFEHLRNWRAMLARIAGWLRPEGRMFLHVFTHRSTGYPFTIDGDGDWMARNFFTGGQMPADGQILYLQDDLQVERHWRVSGEHYRRTAAAWRQNFDRNLPALLPILQQTWNGSHRAMLHGWRTFFLSCEELFGYRGGEEWFVSHYRLRPRAGR